MRKIILILVFLISLQLLFSCQRAVSKSELEFFNETIFRETDSIIYIKESSGWKNMKEKLSPKKNYYYDFDSNKTFELTISEYKYILSEIKANENYNWDSNLFINSERISQSEARRYLKQRNRPFNLEFDRALKENDMNVLMKPKYRPYFADSFSKPIFFRHNQYCIISYDCIAEDISSDHGEIAIYKKVNKGVFRWVRCVIL